MEPKLRHDCNNKIAIIKGMAEGAKRLLDELKNGHAVESPELERIAHKIEKIINAANHLDDFINPPQQKEK